MGMARHRLSEIDEDQQTAFCAFCNKRVDVKKRRKKYWACKVGAAAEWARYAKYGKLSKALGTHRQRSIEEAGGKCFFCGYSRCKRSLHLHHVDPATKGFGIGGTGKIAWERVAVEIRKCILVCANCHGEIHDGMISQAEVERAYVETWSAKVCNDV